MIKKIIGSILLLLLVIVMVRGDSKSTLYLDDESLENKYVTDNILEEDKYPKFVGRKNIWLEYIDTICSYLFL